MTTPSLLSTVLTLPSRPVPSLPETASVENESVLHARLLFVQRSSRWAHGLQQFLKRGFDLMAASLGLLLIFPLLLALAIAVRLDSPGPIFYRSERIGRQGRPFFMYKFRTMRTDADALREQLRRQAQLEKGLFKMKNDPRVTRIGRWLRAFSLDELPQLLNVILGDMSLVGPRPLPPDESHLFEEPYTLRFQVYPGITGAWQVSGRSHLSFETLCQLELDYILGWSLRRDAMILLKTLPAVLASRGAY